MEISLLSNYLWTSPSCHRRRVKKLKRR